MIWFDLVTPKSVLFFLPIIKELERKKEKVLITAREGSDYQEVVKLLNLYHINFVNRGEFGGKELFDKLKASLERQKALMEYISIFNVKKLVSLSSVDATRVAFGLGIPIYNFYDIPLSDYTSDFKKALPQARLTIPLATKMFKPFVVPDEIFLRFSLEKEQIHEYKFIDPLIWLKDFKPDFNYVKSIFEKYNLDINKPFIVIREEEYKASYVNRKYPFLYNAIPKIHKQLDVNILIIPRYEPTYLEKEFPFATILKEKIVVQHLLAFASLFIGGGGTMNTESCYFGTPTISTRSFISHYDKFQIDNELMVWVNSEEELLKNVKNLIGKRNDEKAKKVFGSMKVDIDFLVKEIMKDV